MPNLTKTPASTGGATYASANFKKNNTIALVLKIIIYFCLSLWAFTTIFPFIWVLMNSFKDKTLILSNSFSFPNPITFANYTEAFSKQNIMRSYFNSFVVSGTVTVAVLFFGSMTSFAMTRFKFKGRSFIYLLFIGSLMFPSFSTVIPVFKMVNNMGLIDNPIGVILPQVAGNLSFAITVMMSFMMSLPLELEEAAFLEGCNTWQIYYKIILPLSRTSFATVAIFTFLWSYNDLFMQMIILRKKESFPICNLLREISSQFGTDYGLMAAAVALVVIPLFILYFFLQKTIIKGMTAGAVKG